MTSKDIFYFEPFREVLAPDELLEYKGIKARMGVSNSRFAGPYGILKSPKDMSILAKQKHECHLGGESRQGIPLHYSYYV